MTQPGAELDFQIADLQARVAALEDTPPDPPEPPLGGDAVLETARDAGSVSYRAIWDDRVGPYTLRLRWADGSACRSPNCSPPHPVENAASPFDGTVLRGTADRSLVVMLLYPGSPPNGDTLGVLAVPAVSGGPPPPLPPPSGPIGSGPNEPTGFTKRFQGDGESDASMTAQGWRWRNVRHGVAEPSFPNSPTLRAHYRQGYGNDNVLPGTRGSSNGTNYKNGPHDISPEQYLTALMKLSANWVNGAGLKILSPGARVDGGMSAWGHISAFGGLTVATRDELKIQYSHKIPFATGGGQNTPQELRTNVRIPLGVVNRIEVYNKVSTGRNVADGIVRVWLNGLLVIDRTDLVYYTDVRPDNYKLMQGCFWFPSIGGRTDGNDPAQDFWLDDVYVSTP